MKKVFVFYSEDWCECDEEFDSRDEALEFINSLRLEKFDGDAKGRACLHRVIEGVELELAEKAVVTEWKIEEPKR